MWNWHGKCSRLRRVNVGLWKWRRYPLIVEGSNDPRTLCASILVGRQVSTNTIPRFCVGARIIWRPEKLKSCFKPGKNTRLHIGMHVCRMANTLKCGHAGARSRPEEPSVAANKTRRGGEEARQNRRPHLISNAEPCGNNSPEFAQEANLRHHIPFRPPLPQRKLSGPYFQLPSPPWSARATFSYISINDVSPRPASDQFILAVPPFVISPSTAIVSPPSSSTWRAPGLGPWLWPDPSPLASRPRISRDLSPSGYPSMRRDGSARPEPFHQYPPRFYAP